jgi:hypothetical protein
VGGGVAQPTKRTAKKVIDEAIREGRKWEWLCYSLVVVFVLLGIVIIAIGIIRESGLTALAGSIFTICFWPALRYAESVRKDLARTRLYELPLTAAKGADELTKILNKITGSPSAEHQDGTKT